MTVLAHVSDVRVDGSERNAERAEQVVAHLNGLPTPPDVVLVTGDIADHGRTTEYEQARKILSSPHPVLTCPGNHDPRRAHAQALLGQPGGDAPINQVHRVAGATSVLCDSTIPGRDDGYLADQTLDWLDSVLTDSSADTAVFVCFHHPPVALHSPFIDEIRQHGEQRLAEIIARYPQVVAVLCGHAHTPAATTFAGRPLLVAPGVVNTEIAVGTQRRSRLLPAPGSRLPHPRRRPAAHHPLPDHPVTEPGTTVGER